MSDLITIHHLNRLIADQAAILQHPAVAQLPAHDPIFPERNEHEFAIDDERWSVTIERTARVFVHRDSGRSLSVAGDHPSPFAFSAKGLCRYVQSLDDDQRITELVVENWVVAAFRLGRLIATEDHPGYYTFAR